MEIKKEYKVMPLEEAIPIMDARRAEHPIPEDFKFPERPRKNADTE